MTAAQVSPTAAGLPVPRVSSDVYIDGMPRRAFTVREFGQMFGMTEENVRRLIHRGELEAIKTAKAYRIPVEAVERFEAQRYTPDTG